MRINSTNIGNGVFRLNAEPTCPCENIKNIPLHVMDDIARDVASKMRNDSCDSYAPFFGRTTATSTPSWSKPTCTPCVPTPPMGEPDGIDVHVDRPLRENYRGDWFASQSAFNNDMRKYRELERAAKACDWECREPLKGMPRPVGQTRPGWTTKPTTCGCKPSLPRPTWLDEDVDDDDWTPEVEIRIYL